MSSSDLCMLPLPSTLLVPAVTEDAAPLEVYFQLVSGKPAVCWEVLSEESCSALQVLQLQQECQRLEAELAIAQSDHAAAAQGLQNQSDGGGLVRSHEVPGTIPGADPAHALCQ